MVTDGQKQGPCAGLWAGLFFLCVVVGQATAAFLPANPLNTARKGHTTTALPNGKVLVTGGTYYTQCLSTTELYDPATGTWNFSGSLLTAREGHTATLLPNGKVLVAGGRKLLSPGYSFFASVELYDPATGMWTPSSAMATERSGHRAILLPNGKVLVVGGDNNANGTLASAELYDPASGTWTETAAMATGRCGPTATFLPNGKVLVAGGLGGSTGATSLDSAELYDPATGAWTQAGTMNSVRADHTATLLPNGRVLITGGSYQSREGLASTELYDPATGTWALTGSLTIRRYYHSSTLLPNGKVLVVGGYNWYLYPTGIYRVELYDPATGTWTMPYTLNSRIGRYSHTAIRLSNGQVMVVGGQGSPPDVPLATVEIFDPTAGWTATGGPRIQRYNHTATLLTNGQVLVAGGYIGNSPNPSYASAECYNPATECWAATGSMNTGRCDHTATLLSNGKVLVAGGYDGSTPLASAELYDPTTGNWTMTGAMKEARYYHQATLLPNGKVLVIGGRNDVYPDFNPLVSAELYDPANGTWTSIAAMATARWFPTTTLLENGEVLVVGGCSIGYNLLDTAELYNLAADQWRATSPMTAMRYRHTATLLPNGKVLVAGGITNLYHWDKITTKAEIYDPATGAWTPTGAMNSVRETHTATLLPGGKVLIAAGDGASYYSTAEVYDPVIGMWTLTGPMTAVRKHHTTTLLPNGKVLAVGGGGETDYGAELYFPFSGALSAIMVTRAQVEPGGAFQISFKNTPGASFRVYATESLSLPPSNWTDLGRVTESSPGQFQFTDPEAANLPKRFYRVCVPTTSNIEHPTGAAAHALSTTLARGS